MIKQTLIVLCLVLVTLSASPNDCQPLYWQINSTYQMTNDEVKQYTKVPINISDLNKTVQEDLVITCKYSLNHAIPIQTYDGSNVNITGNETDTIIVNNNVVNIAISYLVNKTSGNTLAIKGYNGTGLATINKMVVNFTKKLISRAGVSGFELVKYNFDLPNNVKPTDFVPTITSAVTNTTFWNMTTDDLYKEMRTMINASLNLSLTNAVKAQSFVNTFGGETYAYSFMDTNITFSSHMDTVSFIPTGGIVIGYDMSIVNGTSNCSTFVPSDQTRSSSYITFQLIQSMLDFVSQNSASWTNMRLDGSNTKSNVFQFFMADLEDILPAAVDQYPSLLSKTFANCSIAPNSSVLSIDTTYKLVKLAAKWQCSLYIDGTDIKLIELAPEISYEVKLAQEGDRLKSVITSAQITGCEWKPLPEFPIANPNLANFYLKSLSGTFVGRNSIGTGFRQPIRRAPIFQFNQDYIRIWEGSNQMNLRAE